MVQAGERKGASLSIILVGLLLAGCSNGNPDHGGVPGSGGMQSATGGVGASEGAATGGTVATGGAGTSTGGDAAGGVPGSGGSTGGGTTAGGTGGVETGGSAGSEAGGATAGGTGGHGASEAGGSGGVAAGGGGTGGSGGGSFDGKELFLLIGQSNMSGMSPMPSDPWPINERVTFMVQFDCERLGQTAGEWLPAEPPLHGCQWATGGIGLGLADFFGAKLAEEWPDSKIGLIPNAIPGQLISIYLKEGGTSAPVPPGYANAYEMTVERSIEAQQEGRIRAILMHQGESDNNQGMSGQWLERVATVVADLRADLDLGEEVPFLAGEIGPSQWEEHNAYVDQIPDYVPNSAVISSEGTAIHDSAHFDIPSAKLMGERYVEKFLEMVDRP